MEKRRSLMGEAPRMLVIVGPMLVLSIVASFLFPDAASFTLRFRGLFVVAACFLALAGLLFWISAAFELVRAWRRRQIAIRGAYGLCRHPIFAVWIWFVLPAAAFFFDSWYLLAADLAFLLVSVLTAPREEAEMIAEFGEDYTAYARRVRAIVPIPRVLPFTGVRFLKGIGGIAGLFLLAVVSTVLLAIPAGLRLGATRSEVARTLPGDELASSPAIVYTQAITIHAPPEDVWPWLVQVGYRRAGWYNIDAINRLAAPDYFIDGDHSSNRIHPELQVLRVGDGVGLAPGIEFTVAALVPERYLLISKGAGPGVERTSPEYMNVVWSFNLFPVGKNRTRVVVRYSTEFNGGLSRNFWAYLFNDLGGALLQQPAMLYGLKVRAEGAGTRLAGPLSPA